MNNPEDRLAAYAENNCIPLTVAAELTYRCNQRCIHCYVVPGEEEQRPELTTDEWLKLLDELALAGCLYLTYTGGEAMLRPDFWKLVQAAIERNFALQIFTNGLLVDEAAARRLVELNVLAVGVSLYGVTPETHDRITRLPGSFERSLKAIRRLRQAGLTVFLKHVIMRENKKAYPSILRLAAELGAIPQLDPILVPANDGSLGPTAGRLADAELAEVLGDKRVNPALDFDGQQMPELCSAGLSTCSINPYGDVTPCLQLLLPAGNVRRQRFMKIWREAPTLELIRSLRPEDISGCRNCKLLHYCARCPGLALLEDGDLLGPSRIACRQARIFKELYTKELTLRGAHE